MGRLNKHKYVGIVCVAVGGAVQKNMNNGTRILEAVNGAS